MVHPTIIKLLQRRLTNSKGCWLWGGCKGGSLNYGQICLDGKTVYVHRVSAKMYLVDYSDSLFVCHKPIICDEPACWNPSHIYMGTQSDNMLDKWKHKTHCKNGHELSLNNVRIRKRTYTRICIKCEKETARLRVKF